MNRRRFLLRSLGATLALPGLSSLTAKTVGGNAALQAAKGAGIGARRFVAIGNLLGFQTKQLFPTTSGRAYEKTALLEPLWENRERLTVFRGLDHGVKGGHFAVHSFLSGVLNSEAQNRPDGNVSLDQFLAEEIGHPENAAIRPWFYTWAVTSRAYPQGCRMVEIPGCLPPGLRPLAATIEKNGAVQWSLTVVNDADKPRTVTIKVPDVKWKSTLHRYHYFKEDRPVDADGFPVVKAVETDVDLAAGVSFVLPSRGVIVATTIPIGRE